MSQLLLRSRRIVTPRGEREGVVVVEEGRVLRVAPYSTTGAALEDVGDLVVSPGIVDPHVHVNEPGRTHWEGFETATCAAVSGGVTTFIDMPLNSDPVTTCAAALSEKVAAAGGKCRMDVGFYGGLVPGGAARLPELVAAGVFGIKAFLCDSGLDDFPAVGRDDLCQAMELLAGTGLPLLAHAELNPDGATLCSRRRYADYLASRPDSCEERAIELLIELCAQTACPVHIVHLASGRPLAALRAARERGLPITVETCPHYLYFDAARIPDGATQFKCAPPIRSLDDCEQLWAALQGGDIDMIASDHSPCPPQRKALGSGDFAAAWGGISSLGLTLSACWSGARRRGCGPADLARWMSERPAAIFGLSHRKGRIAPGMDADLVVWDPDAAFSVVPEGLVFRHPISPYCGERLYGTVCRTYLRGALVFDGVEFPGDAGGVSLQRRAPDAESVAALDRLEPERAKQMLEHCCGAGAWVERLLDARPFSSPAALEQVAEEAFDALEEADWLEAFSAHPEIGDLDSLREKFHRGANWSRTEQGSVGQASEETLQSLLEGNVAYRKRFGFTFIVCATGKSAGEMAAILSRRLENDRRTELEVASREQREITRIRLGKL